MFESERSVDNDLIFELPLNLHGLKKNLHPVQGNVYISVQHAYIKIHLTSGLKLREFISWLIA